MLKNKLKDKNSPINCCIFYSTVKLLFPKTTKK